MKKKIFIPITIILLLCLSLVSLASCKTLSAEEGFKALKAAYENSVKVDEANQIYNGEIYYYKEQDRRAIESVYNPSSDAYVAVSLKNTTVNMHCYVDDDYAFHPDRDFGVYVLEDRYVETQNSVGNTSDKYNNNVVYNAQNGTVTYSEDFPMAGSSATDFDLSSAEKYGVYATLSSEAGALGVNRFLAASTGEVFGFNVLTNSDGLRGQLQQYMTGISARDFANSSTVQPYTLASRLREVGLLEEGDITFEGVTNAAGSKVGGAKRQMNLTTLTFKMTDGYAERFTQRTGLDPKYSLFTGSLYVQIELTFDRISNIFVYRADAETTGILAADKEVYNLQISYLGPNLGAMPHTADYCKKCEYTGDIPQTGYKEWKCPECGNTDGKQMDVTDSSWYEEVNTFFKG